MLAAKLSAAFLLFVLVSVKAEMPEEFHEIFEECGTEFGISVESMKAHAHEEVPEDKKCVYKCIATKMGVMNENGDLDFPGLKAKLTGANAPAEMINNVDKCSNIKLDDPCDTARAICKCITGK